MKQQVECKSHKHNLKRLEHCFKGIALSVPASCRVFLINWAVPGSRAVDWLLQSGHAQARSEAVEVCRLLLQAGNAFANLPGLDAEFTDDDRAYYQFLV